MSRIKLARIDFRLIHGQVVTNWIQQVSADSILIIDDDLVNDEFMAKVYLMASPPGVKVAIRSIDNAVYNLKNNIFKNKELLLLFKSVKSAHQAFEKGLPVHSLQIGGLGSETHKKRLSNEISLSEKELELLMGISEKNVDITFQVTPKDRKFSLNDAKKLFE